jgi:Ca2+-binding RTX toxin-like protein
VGCCPASYTPKALSNQSDVVAVSNPKQCVLGNGGDDVIAANISGQVVLGGAGNDTISVGNGNNFVVGGRGADTISLGTGDDTVVIFDLCEVQAGEVIDMGTGNDTLIAPVPLAQLSALGLQIANVDHVIVKSQSCRSECTTLPSCSGHGHCVDLGTPGQMGCECDEPYAGEHCETTRVDPQVQWTYHPPTPTDSLGIGATQASGQILTDRKDGVVRFSTSGELISVWTQADANFSFESRWLVLRGPPRQSI